MTELRTLKDLIWHKNCNYDLSTMESFTWKLKQEAIKWVKFIDNPIKDREVAFKLDLYNKCKTQEEIQNCLFGARQLLIVNFNLTEEDLK